MRPTRHSVALAFLAIGIPTALCAQERQAAPKSKRADAPAQKDASGRKPPTYRVLRVVDGRTISISVEDKPTEVRLIGVELPTPTESRAVAQKVRKQGTDALAKLLKDKSVAMLYEEGADRQDEQGRVYAYVYRSPDGLFVNRELIRQGLAYTSDFPFSYLGEFQQSEMQAREAQKGFWGTGDVAARANADNAAEKQDTPAKSAKSADRTRAKDKEKVKAKDEASDPTVYVTRTGSMYHAQGCRALPAAPIAKLLSVAADAYTPCPRCKPPTLAAADDKTDEGETKPTSASKKSPRNDSQRRRDTAARKRAEARQLMERMYQDTLNNSGPVNDGGAYGPSPYP
jgi:micrococcal nuclease